MAESKSQSLSDSVDEKELSALMRKTQAGDREAYGLLLVRVKALIESYVKNSMFRFGHSASGAQHEDLVQEILLGLHSKRANYDPSQFFLPWLYAIARYKVVDYVRDTKKRGTSVPIEDHPSISSDGPTPESALAGAEATELLGSLPQKQRKVLELVKIEGLSVAEASVRTGFSTSDIKVTVHRAMKALQKRMRGSE